MSDLGVNYPATRPLRDNELNAVINALDTNGDKVLQKDELFVTTPALRRELDTNRNGRFEDYEVKEAFRRDRIQITLTRRAAEQVLLKFDSNQDGYLSRGELEMNDKLFNMVDGYGSRKYAFENGHMVYDSKGRLRPTGEAVKGDGRISISELANAIGDGQLKISDRVKYITK